MCDRFAKVTNFISYSKLKEKKKLIYRRYSSSNEMGYFGSWLLAICTGDCGSIT